jgi:hypothetical protein
MKRALSETHEPQTMRIPKSLRMLPWKVMPVEFQLYDGDELLVAVPVCKDSSHPDTGWYYEISVVKVCCDEHYSAVECNDEPWWWELEDADFYVLIR